MEYTVENFTLVKNYHNRYFFKVLIENKDFIEKFIYSLNHNDKGSFNAIISYMDNFSDIMLPRSKFRQIIVKDKKIQT